MNLRTLIGIEGLHQIHLDFQRSAASLANILIDVFAFARVAADVAEPQGVHPKPPQPGLVQASHGDLLQAQNTEGTVGCHWILLDGSRGSGVLGIGHCGLIAPGQ